MEKRTLRIDTIERKTNRLGIRLIIINGEFVTIDSGEKVGEEKEYFFVNESKRQICFTSDKEETQL